MALYNVLFDIAARTAKFEEAMTRVDRRLEGMQRSAGKMTKALANVFATGMIARWIGSMVEAGSRLDDMAKKTGLSVEVLSRLQYVAERGGTTIESLTTASSRLAKSLGAAGDEGKLVETALKQLGVTAGQLRSANPDKQLMLIADAMGSITNPTDRARIAMTLFGRSGVELLPILSDSAEGIRALSEEADRFAITVETHTAEQLARLGDQFDKMKGQARGAGLELAALASGPIGLVLKGWSLLLAEANSIFGVNISRLEELKRLAAPLVDEIARLQDMQKSGAKAAWIQERIDALREELKNVREQQREWKGMADRAERYEEDVAKRRLEAAEAAEAEAQRLEDQAEAAEKAAEAYAKYRAELKAIVDHEKMLNDLEVKYPTALLDDAELERELDRTGSMIRKQAEEDEKVFTSMYQRMSDTFGEKMGEMTVFAEQGYRNIQSYLAEFLFDPFDKGLRGMLHGFVNVIRRMVAEAASTKILESLGFGGPGGGVLGGFLGALFGSAAGPRIDRSLGMAMPAIPTFARGGYLKPGGVGIAGEGGKPELIFGGRHGATVVPMANAGGGISVTYAPQIRIDSRADRAAVQQDVARMLAESNRQFMRDFRDQMSRGTFD